ncbi:MAG TPA: chromophore lyase, partial [Chryseobacterium sp.]|nr:chromophore lyase [Chryseobacterium sp.]
MKKIYLILLLIFSQFFFAQSDCASAIRVCGNSDISYFPTGPGIVDDQVNANGSCLSANEHYSVWYEFTVATAGTLTFTISP